MELYNILKSILTDKGIDKYARIVAETDMRRSGMNVMLLNRDPNVRNNINLIKEKING